MSHRYRQSVLLLPAEDAPEAGAAASFLYSDDHVQAENLLSAGVVRPLDLDVVVTLGHTHNVGSLGNIVG